jgi:hypothetical protein
MTVIGSVIPAVASASSRKAWAHFGIAAGLLSAAAVAWYAAFGKYHFSKLPVPPPEIVKVDADHQLQEFPKSIGRYRLAENEPGLPPGGVVRVPDDELGTLGMTKHKYNWYYIGFYRDTRWTGYPPRYVRLDLAYYTGILEAAPHVPDICVVSGGGRILDADSGDLDAPVDNLPEAWGRYWIPRFKIHRTVYEIPSKDSSPPSKSSQYYFFSVNGKPAAGRNEVRWVLADLRMKYAYFAKVQVAELYGNPDAAASDAVARDFLREALPVIVKYLPSVDDVRRLEEQGGNPEAAPADTQASTQKARD